MTQTFKLCLAAETLAADAEQLGVTPIQLQDIQVTVSITLIQQPISRLSFTYYIQLSNSHLANQFNWAKWQATNVCFTDFLWEQTCLECFISSESDKHSETTSYIEINASPNGHYALYQFESYRNPALLPPPPLLQPDKKTCAYVDWHNNTNDSNNEITLKVVPDSIPFSTYNSINSGDLSRIIFIPRYCYQRSFSIPVAQLLLPLDKNRTQYEQNKYIKLIHPCVILQFGQTQLYYAPAHASPPDFHHRGYWSWFEYELATLE